MKTAELQTHPNVQGDGDPRIAGFFRDYRDAIEATFYPEPADLDTTTPIPVLPAPAGIWPAGICPGCKIEFDASRVADRQAKGFEQCIDCMIADGREMDLDPQDAEDYWNRNRRKDGGDPSASNLYSSERMDAARRTD